MKVVILAGGGGTRLFPLSRSCYPKQFLEIAGNQSLLTQTIKRYQTLVDDDDIIIVTNDSYIFHVKAELQNIGAQHIHVITEPVGRNTAPAIALAMSYCKDKLCCDEDEVIFVGPSDHIIKPAADFVALVHQTTTVVKQGYIVTFGITPTRPETGYGYIEAMDTTTDGTYRVNAFMEKPNKETAEKYIKAGNYYWNSGMFLFTIHTMEQEMEKYIPDIPDILQNGYKSGVEQFSSMPDISIDYAVAEKTNKIAVAPMNGIYWNDIGSFDAIFDMLKDTQGNAFYGDVQADNCSSTMILGSKRLVAGIGLKNIMVIDTPDALLVTKKGESQKVKQLVGKLKVQHRKEAEENITMYRPWGSYTILSEGSGYKVKKIIINPGKKLSYQMHYHRSEHWTVISGTGRLTEGDKVIIFRENESTYIPIGTKHRLENPGKIPLAIIEVQCGKYLEENDIVRFDDEYGRK
jgi:mannose-1-phosphate guanylyltransferase/mannose-6-phosphate isomerase